MWIYITDLVMERNSIYIHACRSICVFQTFVHVKFPFFCLLFESALFCLIPSKMWQTIHQYVEKHAPPIKHFPFILSSIFYIWQSCGKTWPSQTLRRISDRNILIQLGLKTMRVSLISIRTWISFYMFLCETKWFSITCNLFLFYGVVFFLLLGLIISFLVYYPIKMVRFG